MGNCPSGQEKDAGLCYNNCSDGYSGVAFVCYADCPANFNDIGLYCEKPKGSDYGRGSGHLTEAACKTSGDAGASTNGCEQYGLWYPKCDDNWHNFGCCFCTRNCPTGWYDTGTGCAKPPAYGRGAGHETQAACLASGDHGASTNGCEQYGLWYPKCNNNAHNVGCCICSQNCPSDNWADTGIGCTKPTYNRGVGTVPPITVPWEVWVFLGGLAAVIIIGVVIGIYYYLHKS